MPRRMTIDNQTAGRELNPGPPGLEVSRRLPIAAARVPSLVCVGFVVDKVPLE
jgi:hypothetical protein